MWVGGWLKPLMSACCGVQELWWRGIRAGMYCVEAVPPGYDIDTDSRESAITMRGDRARSKTSFEPRIFLYCDGSLFPQGGTRALKPYGLGLHISQSLGLSCLFLATQNRTWCSIRQGTRPDEELGDPARRHRKAFDKRPDPLPSHIVTLRPAEEIARQRCVMQAL